MSSNSQNNQVVFQNHVVNHVVAGNEMVRGIAFPQPHAIEKRPSDPKLRAKKRAASAEPAELAAMRGCSMGSMPGKSAALRTDSCRTTLTPTAGDPPAAIWASLVISRALSS
ncbi:MAG: hypothetical protein AB7O26_05185 [Planctomycetaceae bacterium]